GAPFELRHCDLASSLQAALEETVLEMSDWLHRATGSEYLCMAGGVALNCVMNAKLRDQGPFKHVWVQPAAGDAATALGAARSILASPINAAMQAHLNAIKDREDFRPVAPVVLEEEVGRWFVNGDISPYMLFVFDVSPEKAARIPAVRHVDGTARIQTVNRT